MTVAVPTFTGRMTLTGEELLTRPLNPFVTARAQCQNAAAAIGIAPNASGEWTVDYDDLGTEVVVTVRWKPDVSPDSYVTGCGPEHEGRILDMPVDAYDHFYFRPDDDNSDDIIVLAHTGNYWTADDGTVFATWSPVPPPREWIGGAR